MPSASSSFFTFVDEETTIESFRSELLTLSLSRFKLVIAVASFVRQCPPLIKKIRSSLEHDTNSFISSSGSSSNCNVSILVINFDASDELQELAIDLGLSSIPSFQIYDGTNKVASSKEEDTVTYEFILDALKTTVTSASLSTSACCPPPAAATSGGSNNDDNNLSHCCAPPAASPISDDTMTMTMTTTTDDKSAVLRMVSQAYANTLQKKESCVVSVDSTMNGYSAEELSMAGADANLGLGCGNPLSFAGLREGETVVDLGSGAGIDCFLASEKVGPTGTVIGIDMTPEMVHKARQNAQTRTRNNNNNNDDDANNNHNHNNVQFRLGEIEYLPIADHTVDCIISNCVINLSPDKPQVFKDMYRVLKKGGRIAVSDVVTRPQTILPQELKTAEALAC